MADKELKELFGRKLKYWLSVKRYKQTDLSRRFDVSSATASDWCNGKKMPRADKLNALANWLDIELSDLMQDSSTEVSSQSNHPAPVLLRDDEQKILSNYNRLNTYGKEKAIEYVEDLAGNAKYTEEKSLDSEDVG